MTSRLDQYLDVLLGYKSLMNDFFYVDQERIDNFEIEDRFLQPLYMLADLDESAFVQHPTPSRWLFTCAEEPKDLRGTGAQDYIQWAENQEARKRKQAKEASGWKAALEKQGRKHWYHPVAPQHPTKIAVRKAYGKRYAPFLFEEPTLLDQRLYLLFPKPKVDEALLVAFLISSLFPLSIETDADLGLGGGALTFGTNSLRALPCIPLEKVSGRDRKKIEEAARDVLAGPTLEAEELADSKEQQALDRALLNALGIEGRRAGEIADQVARLSSSRLAKSQLRRKTRTEASAADVAKVAGDLSDELSTWLRSRRWPEDYVDEAALSMDVSFPAYPLQVDASYMLGTVTTVVTDRRSTVLLKRDFPAVVAEVLLRALQLGRRRFRLPLDEDEATRALLVLGPLISELENAFTAALGRTALGGRYHDEVRRRALANVGVNLGDLYEPFNESKIWTIPVAS